MKANVYQMVTDRIVEEMQKGIIPWQKPWKGAQATGEDVAINYVTRRAYSVLNQWLLGEPGEYLTFKQATDLGGHVKKGAKAKMVVFYTKAEYKERDEQTGEEVLKSYPLLKYYHVFHLNDCEGIESKIVPGEKIEFDCQPDEVAEKIIAEYVARENGLVFINDKPSGRAYYSPSEDKVVVPMLSQYEHNAEYYSTCFHELTHSTLTESRCNRVAENAKAYFGNADYSREELVAEMGAAMLCSVAGVDTAKAFRNSVAYIQNWIAALKNDNKMIVWAAGRAEKAAKYILNEQ